MTDSLPRVRAVLYDFDGTLADSTELIMRCYRHTMRTHLGECPPDEAWLAGFGTPLETQIARFARGPEEHEAMLASYRAYQDEHHDTLLTPFPGAAETVAELARRGVPLAIVTLPRRAETPAAEGARYARRRASSRRFYHPSDTGRVASGEARGGNARPLTAKRQR